MIRPYRTAVVVANTTRDLTTLASVKIDLGITTSEQDEWLTRQIRQASAIISSACNRIFAEETLTDYFRIVDIQGYGRALELSRIPVTDIVSVEEEAGVLAADEYALDGDTGLLWRYSSNTIGWWAYGEVSVTFTGGYELLNTLPYDLERACNVLVRQNWFGKTRDPLVKSESIPGVMSIDYWVGAIGESGALPPEVASLIQPYRMPAAW